MPPPRVRYPHLRLPLLTARLRLRTPGYRDVPTLTRFVADREVTRTIPLWPRVVRGDELAFVRSSRRAIRDGTGYRLVLEERSTGLLVGTAGLEIESPSDRRGHLGYMIAHERWGEGFATEAAHRLCEEAFGTLRLHKIETGLVEHNERSRRVLRRLGFRREGRSPDHWRIDGRYVARVHYGLLYGDLRPLRRTRL